MLQVPLFLASLAAAGPLVPPDTLSAIAGEYSGELAFETVRALVERHRIQGSPMMAGVAREVVLATLKGYGIEARIESFPSDGKTRYQTFISPIGWRIRSGELWVESGKQRERLCRYEDVPMCVTTYSKGGTIEGELLDVGQGVRPEDYAGKDVRGKVVLASGYAANVMRQAVLRFGAAGVVTYPAALDRPDHPDMIRYNGMWVHAGEVANTKGGFQISRNQYAKLKAAMEKGPVKVRGTIDADYVPGELTLVHAYLRGAEEPEREVVLTAHLDHPKWSANDNASGSAAILEIARTLHALIAAKKLPRPRRTIHFIWVPEFFGTLAYVTKHPEVRRCGAWDDPRARPKTADKGCVLANLNLDMVGEDTVKTNSVFYVTRAPASVPSFLDALLADLLVQTRARDLRAPTGSAHTWLAEQIPYAQGSDHDVFLGLGVPSSMFGHDPDWTHHTSEDTADKVDATELLRVGVLASAAAWWIARADPAAWKEMAARMIADDLLRALRTLPAGANAERTAVAVTRSAAAYADALRGRLADASEPYAGVFSTPARSDAGGAQKAPQGRRRRVLLPIRDDLFETLAGDERAFWTAERERLSERGLPGLDKAMYETVNLLDGRRTPEDIAIELTLGLGAPFDTAWVERVLRILASLELVSVPG